MPKHGSWPDLAEIELSALARRDLPERIGEQAGTSLLGLNAVAKPK